MILYLDTSSLIKLYVSEQGTPEVEGLALDASLVCTSVVGVFAEKNEWPRPPSGRGKKQAQGPKGLQRPQGRKPGDLALAVL